MVDEKRIEELTAKRREVGLTDDEADELGKLFADREGKPYSNARFSKTPPGGRAPAGTEQGLGQPPEPRPTDVASQEPETPAP